MGFFDSLIKSLPIVGDVLQGVGSIGGAVSQKDANDQNAAYQREFAQHGIQWRVADARAAGLHPLYALGGAGASYTPSAQGIDFGAMGQNLQRAASGNAEQRAVNQAQLELLSAQARKTEMETAVLASEEARNRQSSAWSNPIPSESIANNAPVFGPAPRGIPVARAKPLEDGQDITTGTRAAPPSYLTSLDAKPGFSLFSFPGLGNVLLPAADNMAEALESLENPINQAVVITANLEHFPHLRNPRLARRFIDMLRRGSRSRGLPPSILSPEGN